MFAYCLNNPVNYFDEDGDSADSFWGWIGEELGEAIYEWITGDDHPNDQAEEIENQITSTQVEMVVDAADAMWDAYMWSQNQQQEAQLQQAIATRDFVTDRFSTPEKTKNTLAVCAVACEGISLATAVYPPVSKVFSVAGWILGGIAVAIDVSMED